MKVFELKDEHLDFWAAKAEGKEVLIAGGMAQILYRRDSNGDESYQQYSPSTNWAQGGPIIDREKITLCADECLVKDGVRLEWFSTKLGYGNRYYGETPLIAAMRFFVFSVYGSEVDDSQ